MLGNIIAPRIKTPKWKPLELTRDVIWGQGGICPPPFFLKNSYFFVFLPTKFCIFHILPPPRKSVEILPPPEKNWNDVPGTNPQKISNKIHLSHGTVECIFINLYTS